ncbi:MAG: MBL fold metallo-hydrolase [Clostridia bacterium]|nr:MBL fold metallo-hydrolase [Clostridia bacterium]
MGNKSDMTPFRMVGNLYFVGCYRASSHLIDTGDGLILIDTGYAENAETVADSVTRLGFDLKDIRYILHSHGHYDHTDATAALLPLTGAETYLASADKIYIKGFEPDHDYSDGMVISLGGTKILCMATPGHTEGTYSFFFDVTENCHTYRAGMFGGAGTNQMRKAYLARYNLPLTLRDDFFRSLDRLRKEHVDVFVGNHSWQNDTRGNYEKSLTSDTNPFIDSTRWGVFLDETEERMRQMISEDGERTD